MKNIKRSKAFIKIKQSIQSAVNAPHLQSCRQMMENATPVVSDEEMTILKEYALAAWDRINPLYDLEEDSIESLYHQKACGGHSTY